MDATGKIGVTQRSSWVWLKNGSSVSLNMEGDVNNDQRIGFEESIFILNALFQKWVVQQAVFAATVNQ